MTELRAALADEIARVKRLLDELHEHADGLESVPDLAALLVFTREVGTLVEDEVEALADAVPVRVPAG